MNDFWVRFFRQYRWQVGVLALIVVLFYGNTVANEYAVDDDIVIAGNKYTVKGFKGIPKILATDSFEGYFGEKLDLLPGGRYRPLSIITFAIEYQFWKAKPAMSHAVNVLLYVGCVILVFQLLRRYFFPDNAALAFWASFIFAIHPIHIEAVTNLKGRDEILSLILLVASLYALFKFSKPEDARQAPKPLYLGLSLFCYYLALLAKENGLVFIAIIPLSLYYFTALNFKEITKLSLLFVGALAVYLVQRFAVIGLYLQDSTDVLNNAYLYASPIEKFMTQMYSLGYYIRLLFYPHPQSWDYSYQAFEYQDLSSVWAWGALVGQGVVFLAALYFAKRKNIIAFGILFYFISISIVSGIINIGGVFIGDRFLFQASLGFAIALAALLARLPKPSLVAGLLFPLTCLAGYKTIVRNAEWKNNKTLYPIDVVSMPNSAKTNHGAGWAYKELSQDVKAKQPNLEKQYLAKAEQYLQKALKLTPGAVEVLNDIAIVMHLSGRLTEAEKYYLAVLKDYPDYPEVKPNLSLIYSTFANQIYKRYEGQQPPLDSLRYYLDRQLKYAPDNAAGWANYGIICALSKDYQKAIECFQHSLVLNPGNAENWYNIAQCHANINDLAEARANYKRCLKLNPQHIKAKAELERIGDK